MRRPDRTRDRPRCGGQQPLSADTRSATTKVAFRIAPRASDSWLFGRIQDIAVDGAGRVFVLDATDQKIRLFDATGRVLRTFGGTGSGPGELRRPRTMEVVNDTLWVIDNANARLSAFATSTGAYLRSARAKVYDQGTDGVSKVGIFIKASDERDGMPSTQPITTRIMHETAGIANRRQVAAFAETRTSLHIQLFAGKQPFSLASMPQPLHHGWLSRVSPSGRSVVLVDRSPRATAPPQASLFGTAAPSAFRVVEIGWKGDTLQDRRYTVPSRKVTAADIAAIIDSLANPNIIIKSVKPTGIPAAVRDSLSVPATWPAVTELLVGLDGCLWLRQPQPPSSSAKFWRITADGKELVPVTVPSTVHPLRVSVNRIWGVAEDNDGAPLVMVLDVVETTPARTAKPLRQ